jgi:hypothetical protein
VGITFGTFDISVSAVDDVFEGKTFEMEMLEDKFFEVEDLMELVVVFLFEDCMTRVLHLYILCCVLESVFDGFWTFTLIVLLILVGFVGDFPLKSRCFIVSLFIKFSDEDGSGIEDDAGDFVDLAAVLGDDFIVKLKDFNGVVFNGDFILAFNGDLIGDFKGDFKT